LTQLDKDKETLFLSASWVQCRSS